MTGTDPQDAWQLCKSNQDTEVCNKWNGPGGVILWEAQLEQKTHLVWCHGKNMLSIWGGKEVYHIGHGSIIECDAADEGGACGRWDMELEGS